MSWFLREPKLFEQERQAWETLGFSFSSEELSTRREFRVTGELTFKETTYTFDIAYPSGFPHLAPRVKCTSTHNVRHQTPHYQTLCLLEDWKDYGVVTANVIADRLQKWMKGQQEGFLPTEESAAAEVIRYDYLSAENAVLVTPTCVYESWNGDKGIFDVSLHWSDHLLQGQLLSITEGKDPRKCNHVIWKEDKIYRGICYNVGEAPPVFEHSDTLMEWLEQKGHKNVKDTLETLWQCSENRITGPLFGIRYPEEGVTRFLLLAAEMLYREDGRVVLFETTIFQSEPLSEEQLFQRVPHLRPLANKHAVLIGLGAIGSPVAMELAKAGIGTLTLVDADTVSIGNVVRHEAALADVGKPKVKVVQSLAQSHNPYISIDARDEMWGYTNEDVVESIVQKADVLICAVGHTPTERYIDELARRNGRSVIYVYSGMGAASARIFKVIPHVTGCYHCHQYAIGNGRLEAMQQPLEFSEHFPPGCASPIIPGSGIDTSSIANVASTLAVNMLLDTASLWDSVHHILWHNHGVQTHFQLSGKEHHCTFCEIALPVHLDDFTPSGKKLIDAACTWEGAQAGFEIQSPQEALEIFKKLEKELIGEQYETKDKNRITFLGLERVEDKPGIKEWKANYTDEQGQSHLTAVEHFFGYYLNEKGKMQPHFMPLPS